MEKRYGVLRFISTLWKIFAWVVLVLGVLSAIAVLVGDLPVVFWTRRFCAS